MVTLKMFVILCVIGAGFSMALNATKSYRVFAALALVSGIAWGGVSGGVAGGVGVLVLALAVIPVVSVGVINITLWASWKRVRRQYDDEPATPPGGYMTVSRIYRELLL